MTRSLVSYGVGPDAHGGRVGATAGKSKRKKSTQGLAKKHCKSTLDITMESMALSNMITPAAEAKLDESNEMLIKDFTLA